VGRSFGADTVSFHAPAAPAPDSSADAAADTAAEAAPLHVGRVLVTGNVTSDSLRVVRTFEVFPGTLFSDEAVRRGMRKLYALGVFEDVSTSKDEHDGVVDVTIHVKERSRIGKFVFTGNHKKETADLEKKLFLRTGEAYSPTSVQTQVDSLLKFYRDDGYAQVKIEPGADTLAAPNQVAVRFDIVEGEKVRIARVIVHGAAGVPEDRVRKEMKTKPHKFFGGGDIKEENFEEDRQKVEAYERAHGYRDAHVVGHELVPGDTPRHLNYILTVDEGPRYRFGKVSWSGPKAVAEADLQKNWKGKEGDLYDASKIERVQGEAYAAYAEKGYLYLNVEPRESVRDSIVDVTFGVTEGQPSRVRYVNVVGNKGTREKVVRRQLSVHEGDRFRRSALERSRGDLMRLGIFSDVGMDFSAAESSDVDVNVKVVEKQVGTASAGAGYTSEAGLTGFIELGHNNVLGNGQALQLHLERGSTTSNYNLSFTEPWFHDTPTLLGFSLYSSSIDRDYFREARTGASVQIGRPLRWPDYSHLSASYRLENVAYDSLTINVQPTVVDSITFADIHPGKIQLTSTFGLSFTRNSTDNPFYPTRGTRFSYVPEFAGGPFGGTVSYHKHRIEGRVYFPSLLHGVTTMLRARLGMVGEYMNQHETQVPSYERFRLGGGSTIDPLRGYDDYEIVPDEFDRFVQERTDTSTVTGVHKYEFTSVRVRYPGGRYFDTFTAEQQFLVVNPLHAVIFYDAGDTWDNRDGFAHQKLKMGAGVGFRLEIPLLGNIGFDYGYGFNRDDHPKWVGHFLLGNVNN
jgi:outer membrane protein insertion porin family